MNPSYELKLSADLLDFGLPSPRAPDSFWMNYPDDQQDAGRKLKDVLNLIERTYNLIRTNTIFMTASMNWELERQLEPDAHRDKRWQLSCAWRYGLIRNTVVEIRNYDEALQWLEAKAMNEIPAVSSYINVEKRKSAARRFRSLYPQLVPARHEVAHDGQFESKRTGDGRWLGAMDKDGCYVYSHVREKSGEAKKVDIRISMTPSSVEELRGITEELFSAFDLHDYWMSLVQQ